MGRRRPRLQLLGKGQLLVEEAGHLWAEAAQAAARQLLRPARPTA